MTSRKKPGVVFWATAAAVAVSAAIAISIRIHNIKLSQREGVHFIAAFVCELAVAYPFENTVRVLNRKHECRVESMDMFSKPMTDATYHFDMPIPNGTRVGVFKNSHTILPNKEITSA